MKVYAKIISDLKHLNLSVMFNFNFMIWKLFLAATAIHKPRFEWEPHLLDQNAKWVAFRKAWSFLKRTVYDWNEVRIIIYATGQMCMVDIVLSQLKYCLQSISKINFVLHDWYQTNQGDKQIVMDCYWSSYRVVLLESTGYQSYNARLQ